MADSTTEFKPYIPADKITPEFTLTSILTGVILAIVFGPANAYLGLRVGMTISNSIPAAVIASNSIICIIAAIAGDTSQDLKTGYLLGATPKKQYRCLRLK